MDLDFINKLKNNDPWWLDVVFYFVASLLVSAVVLYGIFELKIYFQNQRLQEVKSKIEETGTKQQKQIEKKVFAHQERINAFTKLFEEHKAPSAIFDYLEGFTLPEVQFADFSADIDTAKVKLQGKAPDFETLSRQVEVLKESDAVNQVEILNSDMQEGIVNFNISFPVDSKIFKFFKSKESEEKLDQQSNQNQNLELE